MPGGGDDGLRQTTTMTIRFPAGRAAVLLAALVSTGCATKGDLRDLQTEMRNLAARQDSLMVELRRQNRTTQDSIRRTSDQLFETRGDVSVRLGGIENSIERLTEVVGQMQQGMVDMRDQLASGGGARGGSMGSNPLGGGDPARDAVADYNAAVRVYNMQQWTAARMGFEEFLQNHPRDEQVPAAYFYLGEVWVQLGEPENAIEAYETVIQYHIGSDQAPLARLGLGLTYLEQGETALARNQFETLINTWGDHEAADRAREALAGMGGRPS